MQRTRKQHGCRTSHGIVIEQESAVRDVGLAQPVRQDALRELRATFGG
jgi:hypothetical protein